jgi:hypothetical protein
LEFVHIMQVCKSFFLNKASKLGNFGIMSGATALHRT